jgi:hypothetical protein
VEINLCGGRTVHSIAQGEGVNWQKSRKHLHQNLPNFWGLFLLCSKFLHNLLYSSANFFCN